MMMTGDIGVACDAEVAAEEGNVSAGYFVWEDVCVVWLSVAEVRMFGGKKRGLPQAVFIVACLAHLVCFGRARFRFQKGEREQNN